ncbi:hypothetical protein F5J12DRAFT_786729 [Pisolithus orientalis]|uniref:uncharacterized protein n=1 Tax=Pisolithus orientalis TaxID=936130 RepID=UPI0022254BA5|nr:uncharacterized protein F5J12DRAFT_786729 [Pisolithus orientalis]KAI5988925.1 hypothetical protein F5J12DRAFT_786729 [Pisolithus orientalis]
MLVEQMVGDQERTKARSTKDWKGVLGQDHSTEVELRGSSGMRDRPKGQRSDRGSSTELPKGYWRPMEGQRWKTGQKKEVQSEAEGRPGWGDQSCVVRESGGARLDKRKKEDQSWQVWSGAKMPGKARKGRLELGRLVWGHKARIQSYQLVNLTEGQGPGASLKDKRHPKAKETSAGPGQGTGDPGRVCEEQEGPRNARTSLRPSNKSRQLRLRVETGPKNCQSQVPMGNREGVEGWDWPSLGLGAVPKVHGGPETNIRGSGGQMSDAIPVSKCWDDQGKDQGDQPGVRGSSGELTDMSPVVEAGSGASLEGNSNLEGNSDVSPHESGKNEGQTGVRSEGVDALSFDH